MNKYIHETLTQAHYSLMRLQSEETLSELSNRPPARVGTRTDAATRCLSVYLHVL